MKYVVLAVFLLFPAFSFAGEAEDQKMIKQFFQFNAQASHVTGDIAYFSTVAFSDDQQKTLEKVKTWPKSEIQALSLLLDVGFEASKFSMDYEARPMFYLRAFTYFASTVKDLAGMATYSEVITGKLGSITQEMMGAADPGSFVFYPDGGGAPRIISFSHATIGLGGIGSCEDEQLRLHMTDTGSVGKVESLSGCEGK